MGILEDYLKDFIKICLKLSSCKNLLESSWYYNWKNVKWIIKLLYKYCMNNYVELKRTLNYNDLWDISEYHYTLSYMFNHVTQKSVAIWSNVSWFKWSNVPWTMNKLHLNQFVPSPNIKWTMSILIKVI